MLVLAFLLLLQAIHFLDFEPILVVGVLYRVLLSTDERLIHFVFVGQVRHLLGLRRVVRTVEFVHLGASLLLAFFQLSLVFLVDHLRLVHFEFKFLSLGASLLVVFTVLNCAEDVLTIVLAVSR